MATTKEKKQEGLIEFYDSFTDLFQFFCNNTTIHGSIRLACSSRNKMKTTFWVVLFIISLCMLYWQMGILTSKYWSYSTKANIQRSTKSKVKMFPAITICSQNPYRFDVVNEQLIYLDEMAKKTIFNLYKYDITDGVQADPEVMALERFRRDGHNILNSRISLEPSIQLERLTDDGSRPAPPGETGGRVGFRLDVQGNLQMSFYVWHAATWVIVASSAGDSIKMIHGRQCNASGDDCYYKSYWSVMEALQEWYLFHYVNIMSRVPLIIDISEDEQTESFVCDCQFSGRPCTKSEYVKFHHAVHGNCYTFNHKGSESIWKTSKPGIAYGLSLIVYVDRNEYLPLISTSTGARVIVYNHNQPLNIDDGGYDVKLGTETSISIQKVALGVLCDCGSVHGLSMFHGNRQPWSLSTITDEMTLLGGSYSKCSEDGSDVDIKLLYTEDYSRQACVHSCFQYKLVQQCGCGYYLYPLPPGAEYCNYKTHPGWGHCFYRLYDQLKIHTLGCFTKCPKSCRETWFKMAAGTSKWPHSFTDERMFQLLFQRDPHDTHNRQELAKINIFFQEISVQEINETAMMTVTQLLSEMGTFWALWFGSSVLSVVELVELIFDATAMGLILVYSRRRLTKSSPTESIHEGWNRGTRKEGEKSSEEADMSYIQDEDMGAHPHARDDSNDPPCYLSTIAVVHSLPDIVPDGTNLRRTHFTKSGARGGIDEYP